MASVRTSGMPLYRWALKKPQHVKRVMDMVKTQGVRYTFNRVSGLLSAGVAVGYSAAGEVIAVGEQVEGIRIGDMVACTGAGIANHAEVIDVPVSLAVKMPKTLTTALASTVALGSIALQGVRRANPTLGETFVVIGLGLLGQITAQLLRANGCRVIGTDLSTARVEMALENGLDSGIVPSQQDVVATIHRLTDGFGADACIVTAATASDSVISQAMQSCRKKVALCWWETSGST